MFVQLQILFVFIIEKINNSISYHAITLATFVVGLSGTYFPSQIHYLLLECISIGTILLEQKLELFVFTKQYP